MAQKSQSKDNKVEERGRGTGGFSRADVERRAKEIALIANRTDANDDDRQRALAEFQDGNLPAAINEDADTMQSLSRDPSDPMTDRGRRAPEYGAEDEKTALEKLALEGVEEAQHEQMLQARNNVDEPLRSRPKPKK
jgi:hypothetical protein